MTSSDPFGRDTAHALIAAAITDQHTSLGGPPSTGGTAWAIVNALSQVGFDLTAPRRPLPLPDADVAEVEWLLDDSEPAESIARRLGYSDLRELTRVLYRQGQFKLAGRLNG